MEVHAISYRPDGDEQGLEAKLEGITFELKLDAEAALTLLGILGSYSAVETNDLGIWDALVDQIEGRTGSRPSFLTREEFPTYEKYSDLRRTPFDVTP